MRASPRADSPNRAAACPFQTPTATSSCARPTPLRSKTPVMLFSRRQFVGLWALAACRLAVPDRLRAADAATVNWPSRVMQLPPDDEEHKPPVVTALRLHREGEQLATAGDDHRVRVWNLRDGRLLWRLEGHADWVRAIDYAPHGRWLASAGNDRQVLLWDATRGTALGVLATAEAALAAIRFTHDGKFLAAAGFADRVYLVDTASRQRLAQLPAPGDDMRAVAIAPDDTLLAVGGRSGVVRLLALPGGEQVRDLAVHRQRIRSLEFSPDGSYLASSGEDRTIHILALASGEGFHLPLRPAKVMALAWFGPQQLAAAGSDNLIRLWDVTSRTEIGCLRGHTGSVAALDCRGKVLVSAAYDTTVRVWEISDRIAGEATEPAGRVGRPLLPPTRQVR